MYAIPAETASQNMPFEKENLPGPGESSYHFLCHNKSNRRTSEVDAVTY